MKKNLVSSDLFHLMVEENADAILLVDADGIVIYANAASEQILGRPSDEIVGIQFGFPISAEKPVEIDLLFPLGVIRKAVLHTALTKRKSKLVSVVTIRDVTKAKEAEEQLRLNEERLKAVLAIYQKNFKDTKELVSFCLESAVSITKSEIGYVHFYTQDKEEISLFCWSSKVLDLCSSSQDNHYPLKNAGIWADCIRLDRAVVHNNYHALPDKNGLPEGHFPIKRHMSLPIKDREKKTVGVIGMGNKKDEYGHADIQQLTLFANSMWGIIQNTNQIKENQNLLNQLRQAQKLEAIGTLAAGIAHDFNNILVPILGFSELLSTHLPSEDEKGLNFVQLISGAANRAKELVHQILAFSRQAKKSHQPMLVIPIIKECLKLVKASASKNIKFDFYQADKVPLVLGDVSEFHQVIMNLFTNAIYALGNREGSITVSVSGVMHDTMQGTGNGVSSEKEHLLIKVEDTGEGMSETVMARVFDPFYTTKPKDVGTGLGLSVVHGIIKSCGGEILVASTLGAGTAFSIYLPGIQEAELESGEKDEEDGLILPGGLSVLVVDDDIDVSDLFQYQLRHAGCSVTSFLDPCEALESFTESPSMFDVALIDQIMPHMTGIELAEKMLEIRGDLPIIICTGYTEVIDQEELDESGIYSCLFKPIPQKKLIQEIFKAVDLSRRGKD